MGIKCTKEFHLSEESVKDIIAMHFKKEGYDVTADNVRLNVGKTYVGYGPMEHEEVYFGGAIVTCKGD